MCSAKSRVAVALRERRVRGAEWCEDGIGRGSETQAGFVDMIEVRGRPLGRARVVGSEFENLC